MKRMIAILMLLAPGVVLFAQENKNPVTSVINQILPRQQKNLIAAVEAMPADKFTYQPTPQQMTFAALVMHIIESTIIFVPKPVIPIRLSPNSRRMRARTSS